MSTATKLGGGSWGAGAPLPGDLMDPSLAVDDRGNAVVTAWRLEGPDSNQDSSVVAYVRAAGSETWSGPIALSRAENTYAGPVLAANGDGEAVTAWIGRDGDLRVARAALRNGDGTWSPAENLGYAGARAPSVAIDARGDAVALWMRGSGSAANLYAESRPADAGWGPAVVVSDRADTWGRAEVAMNRRGDALAVWGERDAVGKLIVVSSRRAAGATDWTEPARVPISDPEEPLGSLDGPSFALDESGDATLVAQTGDGQVEAATQAAGAPGWEGPVVLGDGGERAAYTSYSRDVVCVDPRIALDAAGGAVVIWGGAALYATHREAGSQMWEKPVRVAGGPVCFGRALAVDPAGDVVAIWNAGKDNLSRLDAAVLDVTPPVLERLVVPAAARARRSTRFSVAASDLWSELAAPPLWRFGDGTRARGAVVRHAYRRPGLYYVAVTAEDVAGNSVTSAARIRVLRRRELRQALAERDNPCARHATSIPTRPVRQYDHRFRTLTGSLH